MNKKYSYIKYSTIFLLIFLLIIYTCFVNIFPKNFIFASGDFYQIVNFKNFFESFSYTWEDARLGYYNNIFPYKLYYLPISFISSVFLLDSSEVAILNQFFFSLLSFLSFFLAIHNFHKKINITTNIFFSLCYVFNGFTLYNYIYTWGYTPFIIIYCFIPLYFSFLNYFIFNFKKRTFNYSSLCFLILLFHLIGISFGNLSWFFILVIISSVFLIIKILAYKIILKKNLYIFSNFLIFIIILTLVNSWIIFPNLTNIFDQFILLQQGNYAFSIDGWLNSQSTLPLNLFFNSVDILHLESLNFLKYAPLFCTFTVFYLILHYKIYLKKEIIENILILFFLIAVASKAYIPLPVFFKKLFFSESFFLFFRSIDKSVTFFPYFFFLISAYSISMIKVSHKRNIYSLIILIFTLLSCYPFFSGGLKSKYDLNFNNINNFENSPITMIKKIPDDYYEIYNKINSDPHDFAVLNAPYNVLNSLGWQNYVKWKHVGDDPTVQYLDKNYISFNYVNLLGISNLGYKFNNYCKNNNLENVINIISYFPVKYIIYHKDISKNYILDTYECFENLKNDDYLELINETENLILYKINIYERKIIQLEEELNFYPSLYRDNFYELSERKNVTFFENYNYLQHIIQYYLAKNKKIKNKAPFKTYFNIDAFNYQKINPTKFNIELNAKKNEYFMSFSNEFNKFWKLKCLNCIEQINVDHFKVNNYANGFIINIKKSDVGKILNLKLEFQIERLKNYLLFFSIVISIIFFLIPFYRKIKSL